MQKAGPADREGQRAPAGRRHVKELEPEARSVDTAAPSGTKPGSFETGAPGSVALRRGIAAPSGHG